MAREDSYGSKTLEQVVWLRFDKEASVGQGKIKEHRHYSLEDVLIIFSLGGVKNFVNRNN